MHNNCKDLLSGNNAVASDSISRHIAKDMEQVNDMASGDNWTVIDECCDNDMNEAYKDKNSQYTIFQLGRRIHELCKNLLDSTYYSNNKEALEKCVADMTQVHDAFVTSMQGTDVEIPLYNDLKYKTLKQLSKPPKFQGHQVNEIVAKRKARKHNYGDIMGLLNINHTICAFQKTLTPRPNNFTPHNSSKKPRATDVGNLWVTDVSDRELLNVLDSLDLAEPCYVSEETKEALLAAISNSQSCSNNFAENAVECK